LTDARNGNSEFFHHKALTPRIDHVIRNVRTS
jgi:hypothetical protein